MSGSPQLPLGFAHRGGTGLGAPENTLEAFSASLRAGAPGLETDVLLTADRVPVLHHRPVLGRGPAVRRLRRDRLPPHIPSLEELYLRCGSEFELSLDMMAPRAVHDVVAIARAHAAERRLWLTYWHVDVLRAWRQRYPLVRLVYPRLLVRWPGRTRLLERLAAAGVDALNVHHRQCTAALVEQTHHHGLLAFAWGIRRADALAGVLDRGADGVFVDSVPQLVAGLARS